MRLLDYSDKIKLKSNLFDADNEKGADETVEVEIKGLFDGHNSGGVSAAQELYENTLITDVHTAAKVYGNTEDTAVYQDATFFVKGDKNLDSVIKDLGKLDINWREYNLIKSSSNYPALQQSISGIYSISNKLFVGSLIFAGVQTMMTSGSCLMQNSVVQMRYMSPFINRQSRQYMSLTIILV